VFCRSLPNNESYLAVMNVGSETETLCLTNVINNLKEKLYVYIQSVNSIYSQGFVLSLYEYIIYKYELCISNLFIFFRNNYTTHFLPDSQLQLRPQSVIVLTDKPIKEKLSQSSGSCSKTTGSLLFVLLSVFLITKNMF